MLSESSMNGDHYIPGTRGGVLGRPSVVGLNYVARHETVTHVSSHVSSTSRRPSNYLARQAAPTRARGASSDRPPADFDVCLHEINCRVTPGISRLRRLSNRMHQTPHVVTVMRLITRRYYETADASALSYSPTQASSRPVDLQRYTSWPVSPFAFQPSVVSALCLKVRLLFTSSS